MLCAFTTESKIQTLSHTTHSTHCLCPPLRHSPGSGPSLVVRPRGIKQTKRRCASLQSLVSSELSTSSAVVLKDGLRDGNPRLPESGAVITRRGRMKCSYIVMLVSLLAPPRRHSPSAFHWNTCFSACATVLFSIACVCVCYLTIKLKSALSTLGGFVAKEPILLCGLSQDS